VAKITKADIKHVARLAGLTLSKKEIEKFSSQLSAIISYINELEKVNTSNVVPTSQTTGLENKLREDKVEAKDTLSQKDALSAGKEIHNNYFVVPMVLTKRSDY
jgi:aspartyl-tRNA(Asn)/glutamyl-tRNA(Gln) amidotransferase subunit C